MHSSDVAVVVPIWKVLDLLDREDLAERRAELGRQLEKRAGHEAAVSEAAPLG